jgi:SNF2-related domain/Helicase conserved C-terminal domain
VLSAPGGSEEQQISLDSLTTEQRAPLFLASMHIQHLLERWCGSAGDDQKALSKQEEEDIPGFRPGRALFPFQVAALRRILAREERTASNGNNGKDALSLDPLVEVTFASVCPSCHAPYECEEPQFDALADDVSRWSRRSELRERFCAFRTSPLPSDPCCPQCHVQVPLEGRRVSDGTRVSVADAARFFPRSGGVVAESVGTGKTVLALALILSTVDARPPVPGPFGYSSPPKETARVPSLLSLARRSVWRSIDPTRLHCGRLACAGRASACDHAPAGIVELLNGEKIPSFVVQPSLHNPHAAATVFEEAAFSPRRRTQRARSIRVWISHGTLLIVPNNLVQQFENEIEEFVEEDALRVLTVRHTSQLPESAEELARFDVILIAQSVIQLSLGFDVEVPGEADRLSGGAEGSWGCVLKQVFWKRVILDEGHIMSSSSQQTTACTHLLAENFWILSGTPTPQTVLQSELEHLRGLTSFFNHPIGERSLFSTLIEKPLLAGSVDPGYRNALVLLRDLMSFLFFRTPLDRVRADVPLPSLDARVVHISLGLEERLRYNQFVASILTNFITSRREGKEYLLHSRNAALQNLAVLRLRDSCFEYDGLNAEDRTVAIAAILDEFNPRAVARSSKEVLTPQDVQSLLQCLELLSVQLPRHERIHVGPEGGKSVYLLERLSALPRGSRALVFTDSDDSMRRLLNFVDRRSESVGFRVLEFHRAVPLRKRVAAVAEFQAASSESCVLFMSTKLASRGINLTLASHLFFVEPNTDLSVEMQAIARAHRIGNENSSVSVETLVTRSSLEEHVLALREESQGDLSTRAATRLAVRKLLEKVQLAPCDFRDASRLNSRRFDPRGDANLNLDVHRSVLEDRMAALAQDASIVSSFQDDCGTAVLPDQISVYLESVSSRFMETRAYLAAVDNMVRERDQQHVTWGKLAGLPVSPVPASSPSQAKRTRSPKKQSRDLKRQRLDEEDSFVVVD